MQQIWIRFPIQQPRVALLAGLLLIGLLALGLTRLVKNTSVDAFIPDQHHSLEARETIRQIFGLQDPILISVQDTQGDIFYPEALNLVRELHQRLTMMDNVTSVRSLVTEPYVNGDEEQLYVEALLENPVTSQEQATQIQQHAAQMPAFQGTLISHNGSATALVVEMLNSEKSDQTYLAILALVETYQHERLQLHVAGQGAISGYLSRYIDADSRKMQPIMLATILLLLFFAFRQLKSLPGPVLIVIGAALGTIGLMAWSGVPYFAITGALPIVITSIAVADSIHLLTAYYERRALSAHTPAAELVAESMLDMAKPITLTTLTTIAGFAGLAFASTMPPIKYFGLFAALGVALAWVFTLLLLPAVLVLMAPKATKTFQLSNATVSNRIGNQLTHFAALSIRYSKMVTVTLLLILLAALWGASQIRIDRSQIENFKADEPIRLAHTHLNHDYAGASYLDIMLSTKQAEGLLIPQVMEKVATLQHFLEQQPQVGKVLSITDPLTKLHQILNPNERRSFPPDDQALAQYLFLYEASSSRQSLADKIDNQYQHLLLRVYLHSDYSSQERQLVDATQHFLPQLLKDSKLSWTLGGRVNVRYYWMKRLAESHFLSIAISLTLVSVIAGCLFRSALLGLIAAVPVLFTIVIMYGVMGTLGILIEPATSMFAAIAIGVGIDFPIHLLERLQTAKYQGLTLWQTLQQRFPGACRACFFNAAALACGFATLFFSELPTLQRFGLMITLACVTSFVVALVWVPMAWRWYAQQPASSDLQFETPLPPESL
ncbi:hypothetical protein GCM10009092_09870 [Bowmanella denitrificans]|uniref:SSD domain-containing protein n=1 Tax=Bowmanella denitrificans TaxID=366582 RepID=A0ABN0WW01_9ALTE